MLRTWILRSVPCFRRHLAWKRFWRSLPALTTRATIRRSTSSRRCCSSRWQRRCAARAVASTLLTSLRRTARISPTWSICPPVPRPATARAGADGIEVAATLAALKTVSLKGCVVTGDALHCHPDMARQVRAQGGHYLLKLKADHGSLLAAAQSAFTAAEAQGTLQCSSTEDDANDRVEHRCGCVFPF